MYTLLLIIIIAIITYHIKDCSNTYYYIPKKWIVPLVHADWLARWLGQYYLPLSIKWMKLKKMIIFLFIVIDIVVFGIIYSTNDCSKARQILTTLVNNS